MSGFALFQLDDGERHRVVGPFEFRVANLLEAREHIPLAPIAIVSLEPEPLGSHCIIIRRNSQNVVTYAPTVEDAPAAILDTLANWPKEYRS